MTVVHHLDDSTLIRFASGDLDEAFATVVAAHIALSSVSRERLQKAEMYGGHLLANSEEVALDENAFDRIRTQIRNAETNGVTPPSSQIVQDATHSSEASLPAPLHRYVGSSIDDIAWTTVAPGIKRHEIDLQSDTNSKLFMMHVAAGKHVVEHGHEGAEMTLVLSGTFVDKGNRFGPGDIADLEEDDEHQPIIEDGGPCICLVAAEGNIKPTSLLARWLGIFTRT